MIHTVDDMLADLNPRATIFVLVDTAHRTTGGDLGNALMGALPKRHLPPRLHRSSDCPRTAHGRGTCKPFGTDDPQGYLDTYAIRESIEDGTTVPLHDQPTPTALIADREAMEQAFWAAAEPEGVADVEERTRVLNRAVTLTTMHNNRERADHMARSVADHVRASVAPMGDNTFLVAVDREACCGDNAALDGDLPPEASAVVISTGHNDPSHRKRHHLSEDEETCICTAFRQPGDIPQILIVTEQPLTSDDAPIRSGMELDTPIRDHVLLQAIARVNRLDESEEGQRQTTGPIVDVVGVFATLERAPAVDATEVSGVVGGQEVLPARFTPWMAQGRADGLPLPAGTAMTRRPGRAGTRPRPRAPRSCPCLLPRGAGHGRHPRTRSLPAFRR
jgi:type I restriction enzyme R subunit